MYSLYLIFVLAVATNPSFAEKETSVVTTQGEFKGVRKPTISRSTVVAFLGIPYAQPPVGELRFKLPVEIAASNNTYSAHQYGQPCSQLDGDELRGAEDCLYLNIWIPDMPVAGKTYPVLVFLEGKFFATGDPGKFPAEDLAAEEVIVVSVNYRLNVFGFLSLGIKEAPGNLGLWDQQLALKWIQTNIEKFGGDPQRVTLMGHSAGAVSATLHMVSPHSRSLFNRTILMSGSVFAPWAVSHHSREAALSISRIVACRTDSEDTKLLECLRSRSAKDIMAAFSRHQKDMNTTEIFAPVIQNFLPQEEAFLFEDPIVSLEKGKFPGLRVITGTTDNEGTAIYSIIKKLGENNYERLRHLFLTASIPTIINQYGFHEARDEIFLGIRYKYFDRAEENDRASLLDGLLELYSDAYFQAPHDYLVRACNRRKIPTYVYRYRHSTLQPLRDNLNNSGAVHGSELLYLFGPTVYRQELGTGFSRQDEAVSDLMKKLWVEFVNQGDPTPNSFGTKWEQSGQEIRVFGIREELSKEVYPEHQLQFWSYYLRELERVARGEDMALDPVNRPSQESRFRRDPTQPYQSIMWLLIGLITVLLLVFILTMASLRRRQRSFA